MPTAQKIMAKYIHIKVMHKVGWLNLINYAKLPNEGILKDKNSEIVANWKQTNQSAYKWNVDNSGTDHTQFTTEGIFIENVNIVINKGMTQETFVVHNFHLV